MIVVLVVSVYFVGALIYFANDKKHRLLGKQHLLFFVND